MNKKLILMMTLGSILSFLGYKKQIEKPKKHTEMETILDEWNNRKIYKVLTSKDIDIITDENLEQAIFDNIYENIKENLSNELQNIRKLTKGQQGFWATWILEGEVNNGGFNQFYFNSSGQFAEMAEKGFMMMGAKKHAELTSKANKIYLENKDKLTKFDDGTVENFSKSYENNPLNALDTEFYELGNEENFSELRIKYIRTHKNEFINK